MSDHGQDNFATADMSEALQDATKGEASAGAAAPGRDPEAAAKARKLGWVQPEAYNYPAYNAGSGKEREEAETLHNLETWGHKAARYEWLEEYGDVGPANAELEETLFRSEHQQRTGLKFDALTGINVTAEGTNKPAPIASFHEAGLHPIMVANMDLCGYKAPTPIQAYTIPAVLTGNDVIGVAQTGSGKTAAFLAPTISRLIGKVKKLAAPRPNLVNGFQADIDVVRAEPLILVVAPTRELACQIFDEARRLCYRTMLRPCVVYGGGPVREQRDELQKGCDILVATPGRLKDFMDKPHILSLNRVRFTIIDEADELLHDDWRDDLEKIMSGGDTNEDADHRYLMFSATFPKDLREIARKYLAADHVRIRVGRAGSSHSNVAQQIVFTNEDVKKKALYDLLISMPPSRTLVFVNNKRQADFLDDYLYNMGLPSTSIHSDRTQREREDALRSFRTAKSPILITTGVSARGLDIKNVMHVVNFDLPSTMYGGIDEYIHRIGRTARIGNVGLATSFYSDKDEDFAEGLVKVLLETKQPVPDFLEARIPEDGKLVFDDDTDNEGEDGAGGADANGGDARAEESGGWGAAAAKPATDEGGAWGTDNPASNAWPSSPKKTAAGGGDSW